MGQSFKVTSAFWRTEATVSILSFCVKSFLTPSPPLLLITNKLTLLTHTVSRTNASFPDSAQESQHPGHALERDADPHAHTSTTLYVASTSGCHHSPPLATSRTHGARRAFRRWAPPGHISAAAVVVVAEDGHHHHEGADDDGEVERAREEGRIEQRSQHLKRSSGVSGAQTRRVCCLTNICQILSLGGKGATGLTRAPQASYIRIARDCSVPAGQTVGRAV